MAIFSGSSFVKAGLVLVVASLALWVSVRDSHLPDTLPPGPAEALGVLDPHDAPGAEICSVAVSPDARLLATGSRDGVVRLWEASQRLLSRWRAHDETVTALAFFPDSRSLLTAG